MSVPPGFAPTPGPTPPENYKEHYRVGKDGTQRIYSEIKAENTTVSSEQSLTPEQILPIARQVWHDVTHAKYDETNKEDCALLIKQMRSVSEDFKNFWEAFPYIGNMMVFNKMFDEGVFMRHLKIYAKNIPKNTTDRCNLHISYAKDCIRHKNKKRPKTYVDSICKDIEKTLREEYKMNDEAYEQAKEDCKAAEDFERRELIEKLKELIKATQKPAADTTPNSHSQ